MSENWGKKISVSEKIQFQKIGTSGWCCRKILVEGWSQKLLNRKIDAKK